MPVMKAPQIELVGFEVAGPAVDVVRQGDAESRGYGTGDLVLNLEYILQFPIITLGPQLESINASTS